MIRKLLYLIVLLTVSSTLFFSGRQTLYKGAEPERISVIYRDLESIDELFSEEFDCNAVKPIVYRKVISLKDLPPRKRKAAFIRIVLPSILIAEQEIKNERDRFVRLIKRMKRGITLTESEMTFIKGIFRKYRTDNLEELLTRLNIHPPSIILAQAVLESGWGSSRFFVEGNNIFGIWTFGSKKGIRAINSKARLARYSSTLDAVRGYLYNINVGWAYKDFRHMRSKQSESITLVNYLHRYSVLGTEYVDRLTQVIQKNRLDRYDQCRLDPNYLR